MKKMEVPAFILGAMVSMVLTGAFVSAPKYDLINKCEANLPRTEHCHIIAVKDEEK
jgi:hypothetical protein